MSTLLLSAERCEALLRHTDLIPALVRAHIELATGGATQPAPSPLRAPGDDGPEGAAFIPMAAYAPYLGLVAVKLLADMPANRAAGRPAQRSSVVLYDAQTAEPLLVADGQAITRMRTAAATAVATRALARPDARVLGLIGAGALAVEHVHAHREVMKIDHVVVWSRSAASCERLARQFDLEVRPVSSVAEVLSLAEVVCTLTPATDPIIAAESLRPGMHLNAVGSPPRPTFRELEPKVLARADRVVVDSLAVATSESGNVRAALAEATIEVGELVELGAVLAGRTPGRRTASDVTLFNSVGIGLQDLAALEVLLRRARAEGVGELTNLR